MLRPPIGFIFSTMISSSQSSSSRSSSSSRRRSSPLPPPLSYTTSIVCIFFLTIFPSPVHSVGLAPGLYCGLSTCYDVLEITRDDFNKSDLARVYRKLVRHFHPDRVKDEDKREEAEEQFRLIATAYETLKDDETREYYDYYLDHPEERYYNYYQYYRLRTAPRVDVRYVIIVAILLISIIQYLSAHQKYREALRYAKEQVKFRSMAVDIARERGALEFDKQTGKIKKKQKNGVDAERVISSIIEENISISGGYRPPSVYQTLAWQLVILPITLFQYLRWYLRWVWKFWLCKQDYDDEAMSYLIRRNLKLSEEQFLATEPKLMDEYLVKQLWKRSEANAWKEQKEREEKEKLARSGRYRQYQRQMKKQSGSTISFLDEM